MMISSRNTWSDRHRRAGLRQNVHHEDGGGGAAPERVKGSAGGAHRPGCAAPERAGGRPE